MTLIACVRPASGHRRLTTHTSRVLSTIMITNRRPTTFSVSFHGISSKTRSYPMVRRMIVLVGAETKSVQESMIVLIPEGTSA